MAVRTDDREDDDDDDRQKKPAVSIRSQTKPLIYCSYVFAQQINVSIDFKLTSNSSAILTKFWRL